MLKYFIKLTGNLVVATVLALASTHLAVAAVSEKHSSTPLTANLISAQNGVFPGTSTISAGLHVRLTPGWKTYWKSPGEVGIPPSIDWEGSENVANVRFLWPAPIRFRAFGIENFGYKDEVVFPLEVLLETPGRAATLRANVSLLVCSEVCVPEQFPLVLMLGNDATTDAASASIIANFANKVPDNGEISGIQLLSANINEEFTALTLAFEAQQAFGKPDVFPDMGPDTSFGAPDIRKGNNGRLLWASLPILASDGTREQFSVTITDGALAADFSPSFDDEAAAPPYTISKSTASSTELIWILLVAFLGGLILNVMPCVLPVLSIKLSSAIKMKDADRTRIRSGFLASAGGVMAFMWLLALGTILIRAAGLSVGWGLQFQNPYFLIVMLTVLLMFSANMFGLFEINLPQSWNTRLSNGSNKGHLTGDFLTGAFAAILATPCSAPFLGTAVAFALAGRPIDIFLVFSALGLGLALPYLLIAMRPSWISALPKPGLWMVGFKWFLGGLLALTTIWLIWVLRGVAGTQIALISTSLGILIVVLLALPSRFGLKLKFVTAILALFAAIGSPLFVSVNAGNVKDQTQSAIAWVVFDRPQIAKLVSQGHIVFVDVTADWCLTCKANKALVIDRGDVAELLSYSHVIPMRADWTRPDEAISRYLEDNGRFGIPFNIVYGPKAPEGIPLPEVLTTEIVMRALEQAGALASIAEKKKL